MHPTARLMSTIGAAAFLATLAGCAGDGSGSAGDPGRQPAALASAHPPEDFALAVSVISPQGLRTTRVEPARRAARYIVEPDGTFRAAVGNQLPRVAWTSAGGADRTLPGFTRQLTRAQVASVWEAMRSGGFMASASTGEPPSTLAPARERLTYIVSYTANGHRAWAVLDESAGGVAAGEPLVRQLASLAFQE